MSVTQPLLQKKRLIISENLISQAESVSGVKFKMSGKVCDFCDKDLPVEHLSKTCRACPTVFDECADCLQNKPRLDCSLCHKSHTGSTLQDNALLTEDEAQMILNREKQVFLSAFGLTYRQRHMDLETQLCSYCSNAEFEQEEYRQELCVEYKKCDVTDGFTDEGCAAAFPYISDLVRNKGVRIYVRTFCNGILLDFAQ